VVYANTYQHFTVPHEYQEPTDQSIKPTPTTIKNTSRQPIYPFIQLFIHKQMCIVLFATSSHCACPPAPIYPYLRLCPYARSLDPIKACPVGRRMSQTMWVEGECGWCRQCGREKAREGRVQWRRARLAVEARQGYGRGRGRFVRWD
jgi:hypothetical protein